MTGRRVHPLLDDVNIQRHLELAGSVRVVLVTSEPVDDLILHSFALGLGHGLAVIVQDGPVLPDEHLVGDIGLAPTSDSQTSWLSTTVQLLTCLLCSINALSNTLVRMQPKVTNVGNVSM